MNLNRRALLLLPLAFLFTAIVRADYANGNPRLEALYARFMAPCCWAESLRVHSSPLANQMRTQIQQWVAEGKTDEQIKQIFIGRYTTRILSLPEGPSFQWLMWMPPAAALAGLAFTVYALRRSRARANNDRVPAAAGSLPEIEWEWDAK